MLYLLSTLAHAYNINIDRVVGAPGHGREVVGGLNTTHKGFISILMETVQLTGSSPYYDQVVIHTTTQK